MHIKLNLKYSRSSNYNYALMSLMSHRILFGETEVLLNAHAGLKPEIELVRILGNPCTF